MTRPTLHTARLELRPLTAEHTEHLVRLDADPEVMRHLTGRASTRAEVVERWMPRRTRVEDDVRGLGYWVGFVATEFVGWWSLAPYGADPGPGEPVELGYRLPRSAWGRGYAVEGARALLHHGFTTVGLDRVVAETMVVNRRSRRVMERLGMRHVRTEVREWEHPLPGADLGEVVYEITWADLAGRPGSRPHP